MLGRVRPHLQVGAYDPCPNAIIRRIWASANILQDPADMRDWLELPSDVWRSVLGELARHDLAALRLTCSAMHDAVDGHMSALRVRSVPHLRGAQCARRCGCASARSVRDARMLSAAPRAPRPSQTTPACPPPQRGNHASTAAGPATRASWRASGPWPASAWAAATLRTTPRALAPWRR
jgi:hypothetical protein